MLKTIKNKLNYLYIELLNTGERPILETKFEDINPDYQFAYEFVKDNYIKNKSLLDFGCGGGYGTEFLSRFTNKEVIGYDIDKKTIEITRKFFKRPNLHFTFADIDFQSKKFDVVSMFQVIEHFTTADRQNILENISKKLLKKDGVFICATPNKLITSPGLKKPVMVFHTFEYTPASLEKELKKYFRYVKLLGQFETTSKIQRKKGYPLRVKITRILSQIEIVRMVSRHLPIKFKYLLMGNLVKDKRKYKLMQSKEGVKDSITLIAVCHN